MSLLGEERPDSMKSTLPRFVLFGDSLTEYAFDERTQGFGWDMENRYKEIVEIENQGYAGYTSRAIGSEFKALLQRITQPGVSPTLLFTIFLGANDACLVGNTEYVPLPEFEQHLRFFIKEILTNDRLPHTKIILITPPPINIPEPKLDDEDGHVNLGPSTTAAVQSARVDPRKERAYKTYLSKKRYADKVLEIARACDETGRVVGLDYWKALIDAGLEQQGRLGDEDAYDEERLPGCGLRGAKAFGKGYFTDGLHLHSLGYNVLSKALREVMLRTWPELSPDQVAVKFPKISADPEAIV